MPFTAGARVVWSGKGRSTMQRNRARYDVVDVPVARRGTHNYLDLYWWRHTVYALREVDVTGVRDIIHEHKNRTGETLSITGYIAFCLARAVEEDKSVQARPKGRTKPVIFDDVDVFLPVERELEGMPAAIPYIIRRANQKSFLDIHREIRAFQTGPVPPNSGLPKALRTMMSAPWPVPQLLIRVIRGLGRHDPRRPVNVAGTVGITALGMEGRGSGWGIAPAGQSMLLIVGGIARKPAVVEDSIQARDFLSLTVAFDDDVVDGAPPTRFVQRLVDLVESSYGLAEVGEDLASASGLSVP
jgi:hypothetical protein